MNMIFKLFVYPSIFFTYIIIGVIWTIIQYKYFMTPSHVIRIETGLSFDDDYIYSEEPDSNWQYYFKEYKGYTIFTILFWPLFSAIFGCMFLIKLVYKLIGYVLDGIAEIK